MAKPRRTSLGLQLTDRGFIRYRAGVLRGLYEHQVLVNSAPTEHVHHRNGKPWDNHTPGNLERLPGTKHNGLSGRRSSNGQKRITLWDITPDELEALLARGVAVSDTLLQQLMEYWRENTQHKIQAPRHKLILEQHLKEVPF